VELHAGSGYLIHQFLSISANRRIDKYGSGTLQDRVRVPLQVLEAIKAALDDASKLALKQQQQQLQQQHQQQQQQLQLQGASTSSTANSSAFMPHTSTLTSVNSTSSSSHNNSHTATASAAAAAAVGGSSFSRSKFLVSLRISPGNPFNAIDEGPGDEPARLYSLLLSEAARLGVDIVNTHPHGSFPMAAVWREAFALTNHNDLSSHSHNHGAMGTGGFKVKPPALVVAGGVRTAAAATALLKPWLRRPLPLIKPAFALNSKSNSNAVNTGRNAAHPAAAAAAAAAAAFGLLSQETADMAAAAEAEAEALYRFHEDFNSNDLMAESVAFDSNAASSFYGMNNNNRYSSASASELALAEAYWMTQSLASCPQPTRDLAGMCDAVGFGLPYIANPDLGERLYRGFPLAEADRKTFCSAGSKGYTDYPVYAEKQQN